MKFLVPIAVILALTSCSITQKVAVGSGNYAYEKSQVIEVISGPNGTFKSHVGISGANDQFKPSVDMIPTPGDTTKMKEAGKCVIEEAKLNIWNCDLGTIEPNGVRTISFEGKLLSGTFFAYETGTNKFIVENLKTR